MLENFYAEATKRNIGLVSPEEQEKLRNSRVAIAGLGGVGGIHFLTLVRMGIGKFNIADLDEFSVANINRQVGANSNTADRPKVEVMAEMAREIHPDVEIEIFPNGVQPDNVDAFLGNVDAVVDSIDFFSMPPRLLLYRKARELGKPVIFSAPIGFTGTLHVFTKDSMSFEDYYDISDEMSLYDQLVAFAVGLTPAATHRAYMDMRRVDLSSGAAPSMASACDISAGLLTTEMLVILLERRPPQAAPHYVQFDAYRCMYKKGRLRWGNRGPLQRLKRWVIARQFRAQRSILEARKG